MNKTAKRLLIPGYGIVDRQKAKAKVAAETAEKHGSLYAKFSPGVVGWIKLYEDGQLISKWGSGSVDGATAAVDQAGSKRLVRDTRQTYLTIEGPNVGVAVHLQGNNAVMVGAARRFAAQVNQLAARLGGAAHAQPASNTDVVNQLERLGKLRESGVLTESEFQAQKSALLPPKAT